MKPWGRGKGHVTVGSARDNPAVLNERWRPIHRESASRWILTVSDPLVVNLYLYLGVNDRFLLVRVRK